LSFLTPGPRRPRRRRARRARAGAGRAYRDAALEYGCRVATAGPSGPRRRLRHRRIGGRDPRAVRPHDDRAPPQRLLRGPRRVHPV